MIRRTFATVFAACLLAQQAEIATAQDCYESIIASPSPFMGNNGEIFKLVNGSLWEVKFEYEYLYEYSPKVLVCPSKGKLVVKGKSLNVQYIGETNKIPSNNKTKAAPNVELIESQIVGEFSGWDGETIFKLTNGQIWQQSRYSYIYLYKYRPKVTIISSGSESELQVEGMDQRVKVVRIK